MSLVGQFQPGHRGGGPPTHYDKYPGIFNDLRYPFSTNAVPVLVRSQCQLRTGSLLFHINNPGSGPDKLVPTRFQLSTNYSLVQKQEPPTGGGIIVTYLLPKRKTLIKIIK